MQPHEIRAEMVLRQITSFSIAKKFGYHPPNVSLVIHGSRATPHIRAAIADAIGKSVEEVWPDDNSTKASRSAKTRPQDNPSSQSRSAATKKRG